MGHYDEERETFNTRREYLTKIPVPVSREELIEKFKATLEKLEYAHTTCERWYDDVEVRDFIEQTQQFIKENNL